MSYFLGVKLRGHWFYVVACEKAYIIYVSVEKHIIVKKESIVFQIVVVVVVKYCRFLI